MLFRRCQPLQRQGWLKKYGCLYTGFLLTMTEAVKLTYRRSGNLAFLFLIYYDVD